MEKQKLIISTMQSLLCALDEAHTLLSIAFPSEHIIIDMYQHIKDARVSIDELLLSEGATEGGDKDGKAGSSPMT